MHERSPSFMGPVSIEKRIDYLESQCLPKGSVSGTVLTRVLSPSGGVRWSLGVGMLHEPKDFFEGATISEAVSLAEKELLKKKSK